MLRQQPIADDGGPQRPEPTDDALMVRVQAGDTAAFAQVFDRHASPVYALAFRILRERPGAEDVVQEVFIGLWRSRGTYRRERGTLAAWLLSIARHRSIDALRRRRPVVQLLPGHELEAPDRTDDAAVQRLQAADVAAALGSLPADQRQVLGLAYYAGFTHAEIARHLDIPVGTVKGRIRLGLKKLAKRIDAAAPAVNGSRDALLPVVGVAPAV